ncbi:MAG: PQQ-dependent sugar dehydrogenase, partial [Terriglobia bacterium]
MKGGWVVGLLLCVLVAGCSQSSDSPPATTQKRAAAQQGLPPGFQLSVYADGVTRARFMSFAPDGTLYVGSNAGKVYALPDRNRDGRADEVIVFKDGLRSPHSVAWRNPSTPPLDFARGKLGAGGWLYVGETHRVIRLRDTDGDLRADQQEVVVADLPPGGMHFTRTIGFGPDPSTPLGTGGGLYVSVGSSCNVCEEEDERRAAILRFEPDGSPGASGQIHARGLRNAVGFAWEPKTGALWATDNGRDWLGDDLPPEELDLVRRG